MSHAVCMFCGGETPIHRRKARNHKRGTCQICVPRYASPAFVKNKRANHGRATGLVIDVRSTWHVTNQSVALTWARKAKP